jgi:DNA-directed RNA polymerase beta subunit
MGTIEKYDPLDFNTVRRRMFDSVLSGLQEKYPIANERYRLELSDLAYTGPEAFPISQQKKAILSRQSLTRPLKGTWRLVDAASNKVVDKKRTTVANIPYLTQRGTYILRGNEYTVANQLRLRPGVYHRVKDNGEYESHFNIIDNGPSFRLSMDPDSGVFRMEVDQSRLKLYPILKAAGVTDADLQKAWGPLYQANVLDKEDKTTLQKLMGRLVRSRERKAVGEMSSDPNPAQLKEALAKLRLDTAVTRRTLGKDFDRVTPEALVASTLKLIRIRHGNDDVDDRDSLAFQDTYSSDDLLKERITRDAGRLASQLLWKSTLRNKLSGVGTGTLNPQIESLFYKSGLAQPLEEINLLDAADQNVRVSRMGQGGIPSATSVPDEARNVQPSHMTYIDPVRTPESGNVGVDARLSVDVRKGTDRQLYSPARNLDTGKIEYLNPGQMTEAVIAFPGELKAVHKEGRRKVRAMAGGRLKYTDVADVQYEVPRARGMFTYGSNLIPLLSGSKAGRLLMGAKMSLQALSLENGEAPYVQSSDEDGGSVQGSIGALLGIVRAEQPGVVTRITPDAITVRQRDGAVRDYELYNNFPLNRKSFIHNTPVVELGQTVKAGQMLAPSNYTDKNGTLATGRNLRVAYIPWKGKVYEDAILISQSAADKMKSEHMYTEKADLDDLTEIDKSKYVSMFPSVYNKAQLDAVDSSGTIKPGAIVNPDDPIILSVSRKTPKGVGMLYHGAKGAFNDRAVTWEHPFPGVVTDVWREKDGVKVAIKAYVPAEKGDKLSFRFGDKGVIGDVLPDDQMPVDEQGKPVEVVLNPLGVISRGNPSQILETVLGKIAEKRGKPYIVPAFTDEDMVDMVTREMKLAGVKDTETVTDPETGRKIPRVLVGNRFAMKLHHTAESKESGRALGSYTMEGVPVSGEFDEGDNPKRLGMGEIQALISHGAIANIRDAKLLRGTRNDEFWRAMVLGYAPPSPDIPNVYRKFMSLLQAAGVNIKKRGDYLHLTAMTDKDVDNIASGEVHTADTVKWLVERGRGAFSEKSMEPIDGGLFDRGITGGHGGSKWSKIVLSEPIPNPVMEDPIRHLLGLTKKDFYEVIAGKKPVGSFGTGGKGIKNALSAIRLDPTIERYEQEAKSATSAVRRDYAIKALGYLKAMKDNGVKPEELVITKVPVLPPIFRPITATNKFDMVAGSNLLYMDVINSKNMLNTLKSTMTGEPVEDARLNVYRAVKAVTGLGDPIKPERVTQGVKGVLSEVFGSSPKAGSFQRRLLGTSVDLASRATITPNPSLDMDQIGLPEEQAWRLYGPFVARKLVKSMGDRPDGRAASLRMIKSRTPLARKILIDEMEDRPLIATRAPALHRYSVMAFKPVMTAGRVLELSPACTPGFNADFDGDEILGKVLVIVPKGIFSQSQYTNLTSLWIPTVLDSMKNKIPVYSEVTHQLVTMDLADFPRSELQRVKEGVKGPIEFWTVPEGVMVLSYCEKTGSPVWAKVAFWSKHLQRDIEVVTLSTGEQIITDDDPRAIYGVPADFTGGGLQRTTPTDALARKFMVPYCSNMEGAMQTLDQRASVEFVGWPGDSMPLSRDTGYWLGVMAGDGWWDKRMNTTAPNFTWAWHISDLKGHNAEAVKNIMRKYLGDAVKWSTKSFTKANLRDRYGDTVKHSARGPYGKAICAFLSAHLGGARGESHRGSGAKHLPAFIYTASKTFREGMLCGLIDTDGTVCVSNSKKKPQLMISFTSTSLRLCEDVRLLCRTLGISARISFSKTTTAGNGSWIVTLSTVDAKRNGCLARLQSPWKREAFISTPVDASSGSACSRDMLPFPAAVCDVVLGSIGTPRPPKDKSRWTSRDRRRHDNYSSVISAYRSVKTNTISRVTALRLIECLEKVDQEHQEDHAKALAWFKQGRPDTFSVADAAILKAGCVAVAPRWGDSGLYTVGAAYRASICRWARQGRSTSEGLDAIRSWLESQHVQKARELAVVRAWIVWVRSESIRWAGVDAVERTGKPEDGYDLTVPGHETFMSVDGVILSNTMNFHVTVSDEARREAANKLLPSKNITSPADFKPLWGPRQEYLQGLYLGTAKRSAKRSLPKYKDVKEVVAAFKRGELNSDDVISVGEI